MAGIREREVLRDGITDVPHTSDSLLAAQGGPSVLEALGRKQKIRTVIGFKMLTPKCYVNDAHKPVGKQSTLRTDSQSTTSKEPERLSWGPLGSFYHVHLCFLARVWSLLTSSSHSIMPRVTKLMELNISEISALCFLSIHCHLP